MSATLSKDSTAVTLPSPNPGSSAREVKSQVTGLTAGGERYVYDKGIDSFLIDLTFESLSDAEKDDLQSFFHTTVDGMAETFTYTDSGGTDYTARFVYPTLNFVKIAQGVWDVTFTLELDAMAQ